MERTQRVLIVEDNDAVRESLSDALAGEGYPVDAAATCAEALAMVDRADPSIVLLDLRMPDHDGRSVAALLEERGCRAPIVVLSADRELAAVAKRMKAAAFLSKPFELERLIDLIDQLAGQPTLAVG